MTADGISRSAGFRAGQAIGCLAAAGAAPVTQLAEDLAGPSLAVFGHDGTYRYLLATQWGDEPPLVVIGLNPSTATATRTDPTWTRVVHRAARLEWHGRRFGAAVMVNLFALISPAPAALRTHPDPAGPGNDACLRAVCQPGGTVVAAWGIHGTYAGRGPAVARMLTGTGVTLLCFGTTRNGQPRHPGRLAYTEPLRSWTSR